MVKSQDSTSAPSAVDKTRQVARGRAATSSHLKPSQQDWDAHTSTPTGEVPGHVPSSSSKAPRLCLFVANGARRKRRLMQSLGPSFLRARRHCPAGAVNRRTIAPCPSLAESMSPVVSSQGGSGPERGAIRFRRRVYCPHTVVVCVRRQPMVAPACRALEAAQRSLWPPSSHWPLLLTIDKLCAKEAPSVF